MADFLSTMQFAANMVDPPANDAQRRQLVDLWLTPATVADFSESDFVVLPSDQRTRLREAVERFRQVAEVAETGSVSPQASDQSEIRIRNDPGRSPAIHGPGGQECAAGDLGSIAG